VGGILLKVHKLGKDQKKGAVEVKKGLGNVEGKGPMQTKLRVMGEKNGGKGVGKGDTTLRPTHRNQWGGKGRERREVKGSLV